MTSNESFNRDPAAVMEQMAQHVEPTDGCTECGYQFGYRHEGCDACLPITSVLDACGMTFEVES